MTTTRPDELLSRNALEDALRHAMRVRSLYNGETPLDDYGRRIVGEVLRMVLEFPAVDVGLAMASPLTERQAGMLRYVVGYVDAHGYAPTYNEIADALNVRSLATVVEHLDNLAAKGWLTKQFNTSRGIDLTPAAVAWFRRLADRRGEAERDRRNAWDKVVGPDAPDDSIATPDGRIQ